MITTRNKDWDSKFRLWRQHSMSVSDTVRHSANSVIFESYPEIGFNYRMTDVQAAIGREQLKRLPEMVSARREKAEIYRSLLEDVAGLALADRAGMGAKQLAELLCEAAGGRRPEASHAIAAERRHRHPARHHVLPPRARLRKGILGSVWTAHARANGHKMNAFSFLCFINSLSRNKNLSLPGCGPHSRRFAEAERIGNSHRSDWALTGPALGVTDVLY